MSIRNALNKIPTTISIILVVLIMPLVIAPIIHETGHALMAMALGVPFNQLKFAWFTLGPGVVVPNYVSQEFLVKFRYAGGLTAGVVFIIGYVLYSIWQRRAYTQLKWWSKFRWWFGFVLLFCCAYNLAFAYAEGGHFEDYITGRAPSQSQLLIAFFASLLVHLVLTIILIRRRRKIQPNLSDAR